MPWIIGGAVLGSAILGSSASRRAASTAAGAAERATETSADVQRELFERSVQLQEPWRKAGEQALNQLIPMASTYTPFGMSQFQADPGYAFRMAEGMKALERSAAARGGLMSGATGKALQRYGQELGSQEYMNAFNRYQAERAARLGPLQSLAGVGQTTAQALGGQASNLGANLGQTYMTGGMGAGQARASGYLGQANALTNALGTGLNFYQSQQLMNRLFPAAGGGGMSPLGQGTGAGYGYQDYGVNF